MLLHTERLTKRYDDFLALDGLNLAVTVGEVFGLLGPNGSGKTTALRLILGFLRPTSGRATVAGHDCWSDSVNARRHISYLPGELRLYENMTGRQLTYIARTALPMFWLMVVAVLLIYFFPGLVTFLPDRMIGKG